MIIKIITPAAALIEYIEYKHTQHTHKIEKICVSITESQNG